MGQYVMTLLVSPSGLNLEHSDLLGSPIQLIGEETRHILNPQSSKYAQQASYISLVCL